MATVVTFIVTPGADFKVKANGDVAIRLVAAKDSQIQNQWVKNARENMNNANS